MGGGTFLSQCKLLSRMCSARVTAVMNKGYDMIRDAGRSLKQMLVNRVSRLDAHYIRQSRGVGLRRYACPHPGVCTHVGKEPKLNFLRGKEEVQAAEF